uniref:progranulin n=1 Tax=Euleptes europaea TaxID=460621 RepID=UPI0025424D84|nr:progranulin [Euleptes europaea]
MVLSLNEGMLGWLLDRFLVSMWILLVVCLMLGGAASSLRCPDGLECKEPHACCRRPGGDGYACCDQPRFPGVSLHMLPPKTLNEGSGVACPDGSMCPLEYSCLRTPGASYGCCPWGKAVSCADSRHCCPRGFHCSADGRSCFQSQGLIPPATVDAVQCPDGESQCPNDSTCCLMADGSWGCCPIPEASCCEDKIHCCPHATTCDVAHSRCFSASGEQPLRTKFPARKRAPVLALPQKNLCPNNQSTCPDTATCCLLPTGQSGCCPLQNAVCCIDKLHCCPQGTTCDLAHLKCTLTPRWSWPITRLLVDLQKARDVQCDTEHKCPNGNTCCRKPSGDWGCCPLKEAVCCSDHIHCCPNGYTCDLAEGTCQKGIDSIPWLAKSSVGIVSVTAASAGSVVPCDPITSCPDGQTCCRLPTGAWGCCPLPQAVCCPDHLHCCPAGFRCVPGGTCANDGESIPWLKKRPAIVRDASSSGDVRCDDQVSCSDGQTCCQLSSGVWGCCPFPQAVCCSDHIHCCPAGFRCGPEFGTCMHNGESIPWLEKSPAIVRDTTSSGDVRCDDQVSCSDGQTCCWLSLGVWGCCPFPQAVCCLDHLHCCPTGFRCIPEFSTCSKDGENIPWLEKRPAIVRDTSLSGDVRCDDTMSCTDGQTCCRTKEGGWACCPLPQAICCEDHRHCCPSGYTCNLEAQTCEKQQPESPASVGVQLSVSLNPSRAATSSHDVSCDAQHYCHDGQTCCLSSTGGWACCPYNKGSCCSDRRHCCPSGFRCSRTGLQCVQKGPRRWDAGVFSSRSAQALPLL